MSLISLNKFIADSGYCSRREADGLIEQGRVTVNEMLGSKAMRVSSEDVVAVDFEIIKTNKIDDTVVLAYHKPKGLTTTTELADKSSILHFLKYPKRIFPIGRLDKDSEGLLLMTNNGDLVNKILRSGNNHEKEYWVVLNQAHTKEFLQKMAEGVRIDAGITKPCKVKSLGARRFSITLTQGLNRQIRKMVKALDMRVEKLVRVRIMNIYLGDIGVGKFKRISHEELTELLDNTKYSIKTADASPKNIRREYIPKKKSKPSLENDFANKVDSKKESFGNKKFDKKSASKKDNLSNKKFDKKLDIRKEIKPDKFKNNDADKSAKPKSFKAFREGRKK